MTVGRYDSNSRSCVAGIVLETLPGIHERVGYGEFLWEDVKDLFPNPSQLRIISNRGYIRKTGRFIKKGNYNPCFWQITQRGKDLLTDLEAD
jgi:hypothetical protein